MSEAKQMHIQSYKIILLLEKSLNAKAMSMIGNEERSKVKEVSLPNRFCSSHVRDFKSV